MRSQNSVIRMVLVGKRPFGRPKLRWEDLVKRDVRWRIKVEGYGNE